MKVTRELNLREFKFWSGAVAFADLLTYKELNQLEDYIEELYPDGATETDINDLFWFEDETICDWLGLNSEEVYNRDL